MLNVILCQYKKRLKACNVFQSIMQVSDNLWSF